MSWEKQEYQKGYDAFLAGSQRFSWESPQWQHGWNDASKQQMAICAIGGIKRVVK